MFKCNIYLLTTSSDAQALLLRYDFWQYTDNYMGCWGLKLGQPCTKQAPYLLYFLWLLTYNIWRAKKTSLLFRTQCWQHIHFNKKETGTTNTQCCLILFHNRITLGNVLLLGLRKHKILMNCSPVCALWHTIGSVHLWPWESSGSPVQHVKDPRHFGIWLWRWKQKAHT